MKQAAGVLAAIIVIVLGLLLFGNSSGGDEAIPEPVSSRAESSPPRHETEDAESSTDEASELTCDEFEHLSQEQQDEMLEEFVLDFWEKELGLSEADAGQDNLSLEIFNRPYMLTLTEREFAQLSPDDQEKALAEISEFGRELRSYAMEVIAEANSCMAEKAYANAEAYYVHCLEIGKELSINKDGLFLTRWVGTAFVRAGLNGLVRLYTELGEDSNVQMARDQLSQVEREREEMRNIAKQSETNS